MHHGTFIRVVIADDYLLIREGLSTILDSAPNFLVVARAKNWPDAIEAVSAHRPNIALLDARMPGMDAPLGIATIQRRCPRTGIVMISAFDHEEEVYRLIQAGARGFLLKDCTKIELRECLQAVHSGRMFVEPSVALRLAARIASQQLTNRQTEILQLVAEGKTNKEVSVAMQITEGTVKVQVNRIFRKLGVCGRTAAVTRALRSGIVKLPLNA